MRNKQSRGKFDKIKELPDEILVDGIKHCMDNSKELFSSALILKRNKKIGIAHSLLILSLEELIKAISIFNILVSGQDVKETMREIFESKNLHQSKHNFALFFNEYLKMINPKKIIKVDLDFDNPKEFSKNILEKFDWEKLFKNVDIENAKIDNWFKEANKKKNIGLYVDFNNSWCTPKRIEEIDLLNALKETKNIRKKISPFLEQFVMYDEEQIKINIEIIRKMLEDFK